MKRKDLISFRLFLLFLSVLLSALIFSACNNKKVTAIDGNFTTKEKGSSNDTGDNVPAKIRYSQGLIFSNASGGGKLVAGIGNCTDTELVIHPAPIDIGTVVGIADYAFEGESEEEQEKCAAITSISIPEGVTSIGDGAFSGCTSLQTIVIPDSITKIGFDAFSGCEKLQYNELNNAEYLGNETNPYVVLVRVKDPTATSVSISEQTRIIYSKAFANCAELKSITIPDGIKSIGFKAFSGCAKLENITIPDSVLSLGASALSSCEGLKNIMVGTGVTTIGESVFAGCNSLESLTVPFIGANLDKTDHSFIGYFFGISSEKDQAKAVPSALRTVVITGGTFIGNYAFDGCSNLKNIILPESITKIGVWAFRSCVGLTDIKIPDEVTGIANEAFIGCTGLKSIEIPEKVTAIGDRAFNGCMSLEKITIGKTLKKIGDSAFRDCPALTEIYYHRTSEAWDNISKGDAWNMNTGNYTVICSDGEIPKS